MSREKRNKIDKDGLDLMKPIDITIFGSEDDPCFGKLHDPGNSICNRCGDAEICAIVQSQKMIGKRAEQATKHKFKDIEEPFLDLKTLERFVIDTLKGKGKLPYGVLQKKAVTYFSPLDNSSPEKIKEMLLGYVKRSTKLKRTKKENKRYISLL